MGGLYLEHWGHVLLTEISLTLLVNGVVRLKIYTTLFTRVSVSMDHIVVIFDGDKRSKMPQALKPDLFIKFEFYQKNNFSGHLFWRKLNIHPPFTEASK